MANIRPFRGLRYDVERTGDPAQLMSPPYDVIDAAGRAELAARSPDNSIHFVLPEGDGPEKYRRGAAEFRAQVERAMLRDPAPAFYVYHQRYEVEGRERTRRGFIGLIELTRFGQGPVLAHERTLAGPKADRLELMRSTMAHLELVFGMFSDPSARWEELVRPALDAPVLACRFEDIDHTLWRVDDPDTVRALQAHLADAKIYIADGHHRYETMCAFRDELEGRGHAGAAYGMIYLSNLDDPGLTVLPTHRLVHSVASVDLERVLEHASASFTIEREPLPATAAELRARLQAAGAERAAFGLVVPGAREWAVLKLRADFDPNAAGLSALPPALQRLDVALLHELLLERSLGISKAAQEAKTNIRYYKSTDETLAVARTTDTDVQLVCFMNATPVADVRAVCDSGQVMPQKSTFFYPKIPNGLVFHDLDPSLDWAWLGWP
jgi:uncharacterized protein (DUF1015 family)